MRLSKPIAMDLVPGYGPSRLGGMILDLKRPYDPINDLEDQLIENILLRNFISGRLKPAKSAE